MPGSACGLPGTSNWRRWELAMTEIDSPAIEVTPAAIGRIRKLLEQNQCDGGLRLGVVGGGCSGLSYKFKLEPSARPTDKVFQYDGVLVFVDPKSYLYLKGL